MVLWEGRRESGGTANQQHGSAEGSDTAYKFADHYRDAQFRGDLRGIGQMIA